MSELVIAHMVMIRGKNVFIFSAQEETHIFVVDKEGNILKLTYPNTKYKYDIEGWVGFMNGYITVRSETQAMLKEMKRK